MEELVVEFALVFADASVGHGRVDVGLDALVLHGLGLVAQALAFGFQALALGLELLSLGLMVGLELLALFIELLAFGLHLLDHGLYVLLRRAILESGIALLECFDNGHVVLVLWLSLSPFLRGEGRGEAPEPVRKCLVYLFVRCALGERLLVVDLVGKVQGNRLVGSEPVFASVEVSMRHLLAADAHAAADDVGYRGLERRYLVNQRLQLRLVAVAAATHVVDHHPRIAADGHLGCSQGYYAGYRRGKPVDGHGDGYTGTQYGIVDGNARIDVAADRVHADHEARDFVLRAVVDGLHDLARRHLAVAALVAHLSVEVDGHRPVGLYVLE